MIDAGAGKLSRSPIFVTQQLAEPKKHPLWIVALQATVSCALLVWIFSRQDFLRGLSGVLFSADIRWLVCGFFLAGIVQLLCLLRWRIFLKMAGIDMGFGESAAIFLAGLFCNLLLPGGAGGDVVKIGLLAARRRDVGRAAMSVLMDRLAGSVSMIVLGTVLMASQYSWLSEAPVVSGLVRTIGIYLLALACLIVLSVLLSSGRIVSRLPGNWPGRARLVELSGVYFQCALQWRHTLMALGISMLMLFLFFLTYYCSARAYGLELSPWKFCALMPTVDIVSGLPISLGGVGVRESLFALLLGSLASVTAPLAVSVSVCGYMMSALWGVPGAFFWLVGRKELI